MHRIVKRVVSHSRRAMARGKFDAWRSGSRVDHRSNLSAALSARQAATERAGGAPAGPVEGEMQPMAGYWTLMLIGLDSIGGIWGT